MQLFERINRRLTQYRLTYQYDRLSGHLRYDPEQALIICGDPRGGTTWLAELIQRIPDTAMIWEPLAISKVKSFNEIGFNWRQFIPEDEEWHEAFHGFRNLFSGKLLSPYLCQRTTPVQLARAQRLLVKFCRANQLLPWLTKKFQFRHDPIFLVRHPCAVVASQLRQGGWSHIKPAFEMPVGRYNEFYSVHKDFLHSIDTVEKRLAAVWCLCNQVPLKHFENNKRWITITYESLLLNGIEQMKRIERRWNLQFPPSVSDSILHASATTVKGSPIAAGQVNDQLVYWKTQLSSRQIEDILEVMNYFGVTIYGEDHLPHLQFVD